MGHTTRPQWEDREFLAAMDETQGTSVQPLTHMLLAALAFFIFLALVWAHQAMLDEVAVGMGKVIPSRHVQVVQNLEGGILEKLFVREGQEVKQDQILLQIDDTRFAATFQDNNMHRLALLAKAVRLKAAAENQPYQAPADVAALAPALASQEEILLLSQRQELASSLDVLVHQLTQKQQELVEMKAQEKQTLRRLELMEKEYRISEPLVARKIISDVDILRLKREMATLEGQLEAIRLAMPRVQAAIQEMERRQEEPNLIFRRQALTELNQVQAEITSLEQTLTAAKDQVTRTSVRAPVNGTVLRVHVNTMGQVVRSGENLVEIMPREDSLLVEARVSPSDIAFISPGLAAVVKFTAYDFSIYGGLKGVVDHISADALTNEKGETYFLIRVRTDHTFLGSAEHPLPIIPGMITTVDILTGKKTVLDYLLKPILKARAQALRER